MERPVFSPQFYRELAAENPFGLTLHWREVEAWFNHIAWPAYKTYHYIQHRKTVRRWWAHAYVKDLERAREAMENVRMECAQKEQDSLPIDEPEGVVHEVVLRKILGGKSD